MPIKDWHLQKAIKLETKENSIGISNACLIGNSSKLCFNWHRNKKGQAFSADIKNLRLDSIDQTWLHWRSLGLLNGRIQYDDTKDKTGDARFSLDLVSPTIEYVPNINNDFTRSKIYFTSVDADGSLKNNQWQINTALEQGDQNTLKAAINLENTKNASSNINARLRVDFKNLQGFAPVDYRIKTLGGALSGQYNITGTLDSPLISGKLDLQDGQLALKNFDFIIDHLNGALSANGSSVLSLIAKAQSVPNGQLDVNGQIDFAHALTAQLKLNAHDFQVYDNFDKKLLVHAQLAANYQNQTLGINGKLQIPKAFINLEGIQNSASLGPDVVFIGQEHKRAAKGLHYKLHINADMKKLMLKGLGLDAQLGGKLALASNDLSNYKATGNLIIKKGSYQAYGKGFRLDSGLISYKNSPINNPNLDISASYVLNEIKAQVALQSLRVMVHIFGTVLNPQTVLSSNPSMSKEDILSYILFGQPLNNLQGSQGAALSRALLLLSLQGHQNGSFLTSIQKQFGLNQLTLSSLSGPGSSTTSQASTAGSGDVGEQERNDTALFIGKALSDRLFVSYGVGLFNQQQTFRSRLDLSSKWQLITYTGTDQNAVDILYHIDRKKKK